MTPRVPFRYSPSSQSTWTDCPRRWWFDKVIKLPRESTEATTWGTACHYVLENWMRDGTLVKPGTYHDGRDTITVTDDHIRRAASSYKHLPAPGTWSIELWVPSLEIVPGFPVAAKIDAYNREKQAIGDHKSMKAVRTTGEWATTPATLSQNAQGLFYGGALQRAHLDGDDRPVLDPTRDVTFWHNQIQRVGGVLSRLVTANLPLDRINAAWARSQTVAQAMVDVYENVPARIDAQDAVPYDTEACDKYGGPCPAAAVCTAYRAKSKAPTQTMTSAAFALDARNTPPLGAPMSDQTPAPPRKLVTFGRALPAPAAQAAPTPPAPAAQAAPTPPAPAPAAHPRGNIASPNAVGVDPETVQGTFLRDVASSVRVQAAMVQEECGLPVTNDELWALVREECTSEMVPVEFWRNIAVAVACSPNPPEHLPPADHPHLLDGWPYTAEYLCSGGGADPAAVAEAADGLLTLSGDTFAQAVAEAPPEVVAAAQAAATPAQAVVLDAVAAPAKPSEAAEDILARHTTDPKRREAAIALYRALVAGGPPVTGAVVDAALRTQGVQRVRTTAQTEVLEALSRVPTLVSEAGVVTLAGAPTPPAAAPKAPEPPPTEPDEAPDADAEFYKAEDAAPDDEAPDADAEFYKPVPPAYTKDYRSGKADAMQEAVKDLFGALEFNMPATGVLNTLWARGLAEVVRLRGAAAPGDGPGSAPFTLCVGRPPRGVPSVYWYDLPLVKAVDQRVREGVASMVDKDTKAPSHWATFSDYGRTTENLLTVALDRALASGETLPAGGYAWISPRDPWADEARGLYRVLASVGAVVIGA